MRAFPSSPLLAAWTLALASACGGAPGAEAETSAAAGSADPGGTTVQAFLNRAPRLLAVTGEQRILRGASGELLVEVEALAEAEDLDGDVLRYAWDAPGCADALLESPEPRRAVLRGPVPAAGCDLVVKVEDLWPGAPPEGLPLERGGSARGVLHLGPPPPAID